MCLFWPTPAVMVHVRLSYAGRIFGRSRCSAFLFVFRNFEPHFKRNLWWICYQIAFLTRLNTKLQWPGPLVWLQSISISHSTKMKSAGRVTTYNLIGRYQSSFRSFMKGILTGPLILPCTGVWADRSKPALTTLFGAWEHDDIITDHAAQNSRA